MPHASWHSMQYALRTAAVGHLVLLAWQQAADVRELLRRSPSTVLQTSGAGPGSWLWRMWRLKRLQLTECLCTCAGVRQPACKLRQDAQVRRVSRPLNTLSVLSSASTFNIRLAAQCLNMVLLQRTWPLLSSPQPRVRRCKLQRSRLQLCCPPMLQGSACLLCHI